MHCLEVIIIRNAEAAGREAAHAVNDGASEVETLVAHGIFDHKSLPTRTYAFNFLCAFMDSYERGRQEG